MLDLFISYAENDKGYLDDLKLQLLPLFQNGQYINKWHERNITTDLSWMQVVDSHIQTAHVILLLVSPDFVSSRYVISDEMVQARQRSERKEACVIPIILRPCMWSDTWLHHLQPLPPNGSPISEANNNGSAIHATALGIKDAILNQIQTIPTRYLKEVAHSKKLEEELKRLHTRDTIPLIPPVSRSVPLRYRISLVLNVLLTLVIVSLMMYGCSLFAPRSSASCSLPCITMTADHQPIGISDGSDGFHAWSSDPVTFMAEKSIQKQNSQIGSSFPYVTLVVMTMLSSGAELSNGRDDLQGIAVLQQEVNGPNCPVMNCLKVRVLVANTGTDMQYASTVLQQIESLPSTEHILGIVGLPVSTTYAIQAIQQDAQAVQPFIMMSATESSDSLTGVSPYYFRVAPPDSEQGALGADSVSIHFSAAQTAVVFYADDPVHPYSRTLSSAFIARFMQNKNHHVITEVYHSQDSEDQRKQTLKDDLDNISVTANTPYVIYFAGDATTLGILIDEVHANQMSASDLKAIISGDSAYNLSDDEGSAYKNVYFTTFASPDEWGTPPEGDADPCHIVNNYASVSGPHFFCEYANDFDPQHITYPRPYGYTRADSNVIQAYDSASVLIHAYVQAQRAFPAAAQAQILSPATIKNVLLGDGQHAFAGVSGQIVFGSDGNPINKPIVWLSVNGSGKASFDGFIQGKDPTTTLPTYSWS